MENDLKIVECQSYSIVIGEIWSYLADFLQTKNYTSIFVLVDENTAHYCLPILKQRLKKISFHTIEIKAGEEEKSIETCQKIWTNLLIIPADRQSVLINLGGGVIGDMGGFCASTYMRGIDFIQIPTTLLSQVDASVGAKLGVDFHHVKNIIGLFKDPNLVCIDPEFLKTLSDRQLKSGFAEVIKHAMIRDAKMWEYLLVSTLNNMDWTPLIYQNIRIKKSVVESDPFEKGLRKILNFGHTIGHAIETTFLKKDISLLHGEAVAIGMICETFLAHKKGYISEAILTSIQNYILKIYDLPSTLSQFDKSILEMVTKDKKNVKGRILFSLITAVGECAYNVPVEEIEIKDSLMYYDNIYNN